MKLFFKCLSEAKLNMKINVDVKIYRKCRQKQAYKVFYSSKNKELGHYSVNKSFISSKEN